MILLLTAVAGGCGAVARFLVDTAVNRRHRLTFPAGTIVVNATACLLLGLLTGWALAHPGHDHLRQVLGTGFLGGYSTFSTASVEGVRLVQQGRTRAALVHSGGMLVVSLGAAALGLVVAGG
ncbi:fluoride efflux transporter FluC [Luteimicrobium subarcticum]|uniref:Fluoride-specific ion channel FluC n=1 Tax=Luteimicrobium subarcticum TaxID=620910 RepID=A0A2M8W1M4_9MICO|nr:CrcB family protein [Luteimicrobium subarcticum]PJI84815.1 camphor resistance protein CrcB [Luteimicrobium subarcticum]